MATRFSIFAEGSEDKKSMKAEHCERLIRLEAIGSLDRQKSGSKDADSMETEVLETTN